jgi:hypothetical protein
MGGGSNKAMPRAMLASFGVILLAAFCIVLVVFASKTDGDED